MEAKELMIGDWVQGNSCGQHCDRNNNKCYKIATLDIGNRCFGETSCGALAELKSDDRLPIPITQEILEKNGFKKNRYNYIYKDDYCEVRVSIVQKIKIEDIDLEESAINVSIKGALFDINMIMSAIHELQQAFRLCGIEKEMIL